MKCPEPGSCCWPNSWHITPQHSEKLRLLSGIIQTLSLNDLMAPTGVTRRFASGVRTNWNKVWVVKLSSQLYLLRRPRSHVWPNYTENWSASTQSCHLATVSHSPLWCLEAQQHRRGHQVPPQVLHPHRGRIRHQDRPTWACSVLCLCLYWWTIIYQVLIDIHYTSYSSIANRNCDAAKCTHLKNS